jgi:hypothetical protein
MTPEEAAVASQDAVSNLTARFMLDPALYAYGASLGFPGMAYYAAGRGGVLGDVDALAVTNAFVFFNPELIAANWADMDKVMPRQDAAKEFAASAAKWADAHMPDDVDCATLAALAETVAAAASPADAPLFDGWRKLDAPTEPKAAAVHHMNSLRELRFAYHANAIRSAGIDPEEALRHRQPHMVAIFGWEPGDPKTPVAGDWEKAEAETDARMAEALGVLSPDELDTFVALANAALAGSA